MAKRVAIVGTGRFAIDCLRVLSAQEGILVELVACERNQNTFGLTLAGFCKKQGIATCEYENVNDAHVLDATSAVSPDYLFSLNNFHIIRKPLLVVPRIGVVNFHNGPLPRYAGVNVCSWAIVNGESRYGVTWHFVDEGIDTGDIIAREEFDLDPDETALSLIMKCSRRGIALLKTMIQPLAADSIRRVPQTSDLTHYYSYTDIPNDGRIDFNWPFQKLSCFVRGLNFGLFPNPLVAATARFNDRPFTILRVERVGQNTLREKKPGTVVACSADSVHVAVGDSIAALVDMASENQEPMSVSEFVDEYQIEQGCRLS